MGAFTVRAIGQMETVAHGVLKRAGAELEVESFGMQVLDLPPGFEHYPEHDHAEDGMEEVYVVLRGEGEFTIDGERVPVDGERMVRIGAGARRKLVPGSEGMRVLAIGAIPGRAYARPEVFTLGAPDPTTERAR